MYICVCTYVCTYMYVFHETKQNSHDAAIVKVQFNLKRNNNVFEIYVEPLPWLCVDLAGVISWTYSEEELWYWPAPSVPSSPTRSEAHSWAPMPWLLARLCMKLRWWCWPLLTLSAQNSISFVSYHGAHAYVCTYMKMLYGHVTCAWHSHLDA